MPHVVNLLNSKDLLFNYLNYVYLHVNFIFI